MKIFFPYLILFWCFFSVHTIEAQLHENFYDEIVEADFTRPVGITFDGNGRGYVWEQGGKVFILTPDGEKLPTPFLNISEEVANYGDHGLLSVALHPNFLENGYVYLAYVVDRHHLLFHGTPDYNPDVDILNEASIGRVTRYQADVNDDFLTTLPQSRTILLGETPETGLPILMISHGVGTLAFGTDGSLLLSAGEAGSFQSADIGSAPETYFAQALDDGILKEHENIGSFRSQLLDCLLGKVLRLDPETGDGLPSNPFYQVDKPRSARSRIWTLGLRNPYRFFVKPNTGAHSMDLGQPGHLFIGDVGANLWEEISVATKAGQNMGWPLYESFYEKWPYHWEYIPNTGAPNTLFQTGECDQAYFTFNDILKNPIQHESLVFNNPCAPEQDIPSDIPTFVHQRPIIAWSNVDWNPPARAFTPSFDAAGMASAIRLDSTASPVEGANFEGYSSLPGFFYEQENFPEQFHGNLFNADYRGWIRAFELDDDYQVVKETTIHNDCKGITHLAFNEQTGFIYYTNIEDQKVHRIGYSGTPPPIIEVAVNQQFGASPLTVQFNASESFSPFGSPLDFAWDFGDGNVSTAMNPSHTFTSPTPAPTSYTTTLTVTDTTGTSRSKSILFTLNNTPPQVEITSFEDGDFYPVNGITNLPLQANVQDAEHDAAQLTYEWTTYVHHNSHVHPEASTEAIEGTALIEPLGCQEETFWYNIELVVTDGAGLSASDKHNIFPYCGTAFVDFLDLTGSTSSKNILLHWTTGLERELAFFEIQKQRSTNHYEAIGTLVPNPDKEYFFTDKEGLFGNNTYRIRAVDTEGIYIYSNEWSVDLQLNEAFSIYPNPTQGLLFIELKTAAENLVSFQIYDNLGRMIEDITWNATPNERFLQDYLTEQLAAGLYYYTLTNGSEVYQGKLVVGR